MVKTVLVRGGFAVLIVFLNAVAGVLLWIPYQVTYLGALHVWNMINGGPSVISNDGPLPVIIGSTDFIVGVALTVGADLAAVWVTKELTKEPVLLPRWLHIMLATLRPCLPHDGFEAHQAF